MKKEVIQLPELTVKRIQEVQQLFAKQQAEYQTRINLAHAESQKTLEFIVLSFLEGKNILIEVGKQNVTLSENGAEVVIEESPQGVSSAKK